MLKTVLAVAATAVGLSLIIDDADAIMRLPVPAEKVDVLPLAAAMTTGEVSSAPTAYAALCRSEPTACEGGGADRVSMTDALWSALKQINTRYNEAIVAASDLTIHGQSDVWTVGGRFGDCEDYSLAKRRALIASGVSPSALSIAVVRTPKGVGHAVLVVRTDRGDFVLDNRRAEVLGWDETGYRWYKITSPDDPRQWVNINGRRFFV